MTDVVAFINARLDEDEATALAATPGPWRVGAEGSEGSRIMPDWGDKRERMRFIASINGRVQPEDGRNARHVARHDPARVLAEVATKRRILKLHESWPVLVEAPPEFTADTTDVQAVSFSMSQRMMWLTEQEYRARFGVEPPTSPIIRALARIWSDHEAYDPAWLESN